MPPNPIHQTKMPPALRQFLQFLQQPDPWEKV
jgi:hypothetical protein